MDDTITVFFQVHSEEVMPNVSPLFFQIQFNPIKPIASFPESEHKSLMLFIKFENYLQHNFILNLYNASFL